MRIGTDNVPGLGPCGVRWIDRMLLPHSPAVYSFVFAHAPNRFGGVFSPHSGEIPWAQHLCPAVHCCIR